MSIIFGNKLRALREEKNIPQRQIASVLEIDTATYCKIEKGDRKAKREQVLLLAKLLEYNSKELLCLWSADKVYELIAKEEYASQILSVVSENIELYNTKTANL